MRVCECLIRLAWPAVMVAWAGQAAFPHEPDRDPHAGERIAATPGLALFDPDRSDSPDSPGPAPEPSPATVASLCLLVESAAQAHGLPPEFFARLIWQESRFNPDALGPATRNGQRAQGIAQFMPDTAKERGVLDPFDPVAALPKSAEMLRDLRAQFGNLGLAAAAYNAGPRRVRDWLAGHGSLPVQTRSYVSAITGRSPDDWRRRDDDQDAARANRTSCGDLIALLKAQPALFADELEPPLGEWRFSEWRLGGGHLGGWHLGEWPAPRRVAMPWGVQLSAGFERDRVLDVYAGIEKSSRTILERRDPIVIESKLRNRGTQPFYQLRIGADTRASADELCRALHKAGVVCMVLRNPDPPRQSL